MREKQLAAMSTVARHQQPAGQALCHRVMVRADRLLSLLTQPGVHIAVQLLSQHALLAALLERFTADAKGPPCSLHPAAEI